MTDEPTKSTKAMLAVTQASSDIGYGTLWNHYKGGVYEVVGFGFDATDNRDEPVVIYRRKAGDEFIPLQEGFVQYTRSVEDFTKTIKKGVTRFTKLA